MLLCAEHELNAIYMYILLLLVDIYTHMSDLLLVSLVKKVCEELEECLRS